jgi:phosphoribosylaminoimidazole carboxylase (NCAIR synthetase)
MTRKNENGIYVNYDKINCDRYSFETTADGVKAFIDSVVAKATEKGMVGEGRFDFSTSRGYYDNDYELVVTYEFERVETEKETFVREGAAAKLKADAARIRKEKADAKKLKADAEYAEFMRLKEKFGALK